MARDGVAWCSRRLVASASLAGWLLAGPGCWPRDRFEGEGIEALCEAASRCAGTYAVPSCVAALGAPLEGCTYDQALGADCMGELPHAACVEAEPFGDLQLELPSTCALAVDCGELDWLAPVRIE